MTPTNGAAQILAAAEELFATGGYDGVSIQQIARKASVSKANIYHHFTSKEQLYLTVLRRALQEMSALLEQLQQVDGTTGEQLAHFSQAHLRHLNANHHVARLILREILDGDGKRLEALAEQVFGDYFARLKGLLNRGRERGEIRRDIDTDHIAFAIAGLNVFLFQSWPLLRHFPGGHFTTQEQSRQALFALLRHGFSGTEPQHKTTTKEST